jgi:N-acetyl-anhydromuramyl-L-alanine amidase AmpD
MVAKAMQTTFLMLLLWAAMGCRESSHRDSSRARGTQIIACGERFEVGTPVVLWTDQGGYNAYPKAIPGAATQPRPSYGTRDDLLSPQDAARVRQNGWDLNSLRQVVDQIVLHYDATGNSRETFRVLQKRDLSVHFLLDIDGTIYQTLDLQERAWHATRSNSRSIGIEIANVGAFEPGQPTEFGQWYRFGAHGDTRLRVPGRLGDGGIRTSPFHGRPARPELIVGQIQDKTVRQYDFTPEQYAALAKLTAALCRVFPRITCDFPRDASGNLIPRKLSDEQLKSYRGLIGHYHIQANKIDPGPAFQWDRLIQDVRHELRRAQ